MDSLDPEVEDEKKRLTNIETKLEEIIAPARKEKSTHIKIFVGGAITTGLFFFLIALLVTYIRNPIINSLESDNPYCNFDEDTCDGPHLLLHTNATFFNCSSTDLMQKWCGLNFQITYFNYIAAGIGILTCGIGLPYLGYVAYSKTHKNKGLGRLALENITDQSLNDELKTIQLEQLPLIQTIEKIEESKIVLQYLDILPTGRANIIPKKANRDLREANWQQDQKQTLARGR